MPIMPKASNEAGRPPVHRLVAKLFFVCSFLVGFSGLTLLAKTKPTLKQLFTLLKQQNEDNLPAEFHCQVSSLLITEQLKNIPAEMKEFEKTPRLFMEFEKSTAPTLTLRQVSPFYQDYFSPYETFLSQAGLFIGVDNFKTFKQFQKEYRVELLAWEEEYKLQLWEREGLEEDYAFYLFDKTLTLQKALFYEENQKSGELRFFYAPLKSKTGKGYLIPKKIIAKLKSNPLSNTEAAKNFSINLENCALVAP